MPTISGIRRRGYTPRAVQNFAKRIGVSKAESLIDFEILEDCLRDDLDDVSLRTMAVLHPIKVIIENLPAEHKEELNPAVHPKKAELGKRKIYFTKEIYIDQADFKEIADPDFFRLKPGGEVRLRNAYVIKCNQVVKDATGKVTELHCSYDPVTLGGKAPADGRKIKGIVHWVSASESLGVEVRVYGRLFAVADPENVSKGQDFKSNLNADSLEVIKNARVELGLKDARVEERYQFERVGYFCIDYKDSKPGALVFNRVVDLRT